MKNLLTFIFTLVAGFSIGYHYADSRYAEVRRKLGELTDNEVEEYLRLKKEEAKYSKADEILGKAILIYLADLGLRLSPEVKEFASKATTAVPPAGLKASDKEPIHTPTALPVPTSSMPEKSAEMKPSSKMKSKADLNPIQSSGTDRQLERYTTGISGRVTYSGPLPGMEKIKMSADPVCAQVNAGLDIRNETVVINPNGTLANVFVYIKEGLDKQLIPPSALEPVTLNQSGCRYIPHVLGLQVGQPLMILNSDPVLHNIHSMAKLNAPFNMGMATKGQTTEKKFSKPEIMIKVKCDVHGWMNAFVGVLDHPYFSVTDSTGVYSFKMPPPGNYLLDAWHEKFGTRTQKITIQEGQLNEAVQFQFSN